MSNDEVSLVVEQLRLDDWVTRHESFAVLQRLRPHVACLVELRMSPDELLWGQSTGEPARRCIGRTIVAKDKEMRQTLITEYFTRRR